MPRDEMGMESAHGVKRGWLGRASAGESKLIYCFLSGSQN